MIHRLCFLDWDDSLLPSSWIAKLKQNFGDKFIEQFNASMTMLELLVCNMIDTLIELDYQIHIITNSETGWVELSGVQYLPKVLDKLQQHSIPIVSARNLYQKRFPAAFDMKNPQPWKILAFNQILDPFRTPPPPPSISQQPSIPNVKSLGETIYQLCGYIPSVSNSLSQWPFIETVLPMSTMEHNVELLVVGDSILDVQASDAIASYGMTRNKIIKLVEFPDVWSLSYQISHVLSRLRYLRELNCGCSLYMSKGISGQLFSELKHDDTNHVELFYCPRTTEPDLEQSKNLVPESSTNSLSNENLSPVILYE